MSLIKSITTWLSPASNKSLRQVTEKCHPCECSCMCLSVCVSMSFALCCTAASEQWRPVVRVIMWCLSVYQCHLHCTVLQHLSSEDPLSGNVSDDIMWCLSVYQCYSHCTVLYCSIWAVKTRCPVTSVMTSCDVCVCVYQCHLHCAVLQHLSSEDPLSGNVGDDIMSAPYHYSNHCSNICTVLQYLVRLPPFTQLFIAFQGHQQLVACWSFACCIYVYTINICCTYLRAADVYWVVARQEEIKNTKHNEQWNMKRNIYCTHATNI